MNAAKVGAIEYYGDLHRAKNVEKPKFQGVVGQVGMVRSNIIYVSWQVRYMKFSRTP